jgi:hypothetical protein
MIDVACPCLQPAQNRPATAYSVKPGKSGTRRSPARSGPADYLLAPGWAPKNGSHRHWQRPGLAEGTQPAKTSAQEQAGEPTQLMTCRKSKIIFQDHNMPLSCENVELRGFEPLTFCMPYRPEPSLDGAGRRRASRLPAVILARCGLRLPGACRRWLPTWLPGKSLAALTSGQVEEAAGPPREPGNTARPRSANSILRY